MTTAILEALLAVTTMAQAVEPVRALLHETMPSAIALLGGTLDDDREGLLFIERFLLGVEENARLGHDLAPGLAPGAGYEVAIRVRQARDALKASPGWGFGLCAPERRLYQGALDGRVRVQGWAGAACLPPFPLAPRRDLHAYPAEALCWGYMGPGPLQLALALLADHLAHQPADRALLRQVAGIAPTCSVCWDEGELWDAERREPTGACARCLIGPGGAAATPKGLLLHVHPLIMVRLVMALPVARAWVLITDDLQQALKALAERGDGPEVRP